MFGKKTKSVVMALMALGVLLSGIGGVMAQTDSVIPYDKEGISGDAEEIEYVITANDTFTNGTSVELNVTFTGANTTNDVTDLTEIHTETVNVSEGETLTDKYNVSNGDTYDSYRVSITAVNGTTNAENIDSVEVTDLNAVASGGGAFFSDSGLLGGSTMGIPNIFIGIVLVVGVFLYYNNNDEFDS
jgi:hypothetical protein